MIWGLRRSIKKIVALLGCYAVYVGATYIDCFTLKNGTERLPQNVFN
jgi:hypothetical protein